MATLTRAVQQLLPIFQQLQRDGNTYSNSTAVTPTPSSSRVNGCNIPQATDFTATDALIAELEEMEELNLEDEVMDDSRSLKLTSIFGVSVV